MQRWVKLPNGNVVDANRIITISKPESYPKMDEEGNDDVDLESLEEEEEETEESTEDEAEMDNDIEIDLDLD